MTGHGGAREGAGRKAKDRSGQEYFADAQSYLLAVVQGRTTPDAVRVMAAKTLIQYERAKTRAPVASPSPAELQKKTARDFEGAIRSEFERKAAEIAKKIRGKKGGKSGKV